MNLRSSHAVAAAALALVALLTPPVAVASWLRGGVAAPQVAAGLWLLKGALLGLAIAVWGAGRLALAGSPRLIPALPHSAESDQRWREDALALVLLLIALGLRLENLGRGLWYDEIQTLVEYARQPMGVIITTYDSQNQHLLYSLLARASFGLFGEGTAALRVPAVALGVASLWALYRFGRQVVGPREALLGVAVLTFSYHHVWFSQNARGYTGLLLFALVGTGALLRLLTDPGAGWSTAALYAGAMALAAYTHVTAVFISAAHALVLGVLWWRARRLTPKAGWPPALALGLSGLLTLVLYAPVLPQLSATLVGKNPEAAATRWQHPLWLLGEMVRGLARGVPGVGGWLALALAALVTATGLVSLARANRTLTALMVLPAVLTAGGIMALGHNLWPRFFFFSAGFAVLIAIRGAFVLGRAVSLRWGDRLATVAVSLGVLVSGVTVPSAWRPKQDYEGAARFVDDRRGPNDAVVTVDLTAYPYERLFQRPWLVVDSPGRLQEIEHSHPRTWVLYTFPIRLEAVQPEIWARLHTSYDTAAVYPGSVGDGAIVVMVSRSQPPAT